MPFPIDFPGGRRATGARPREFAALPGALAELGLAGSRPVVALVGGAGGMTGPELDALHTLLADALVPVLAEAGAAVVDGGTDAGVMRVSGRLRHGLPPAGGALFPPAGGAASGPAPVDGALFPLVGVAAEGTVTLPGQPAPQPDAAGLEPRHSHFLLVPGSEWGAETPWLARAATALAGGAPSVTLLANGGAITLDDARLGLAEGRPLIVLDGTGRSADRIAAARRDGGDPEVADLAGSPAVHIVDARDPAALRERLATTILG